MYIDPQVLFPAFDHGRLSAHESCSYPPNRFEISNVLFAAYKPTLADGACSYEMPYDIRPKQMLFRLKQETNTVLAGGNTDPLALFCGHVCGLQEAQDQSYIDSAGCNLSQQPPNLTC